MKTNDLTQCPFKNIVNVYLTKSAINRSRGTRQNRLFYSMSPVGHRFLENMDSDDPQFEVISRLAKQFSSVLEQNSTYDFETRLKTYWTLHPPKYPVCSLTESAFGAVLHEVWVAFFAKPCPCPEIMIKAAYNILMVVKDWGTVDLKSRKQAISLVFDAVEEGLNPQLNFKSAFSNMHEVIFALIVSAVDEISEGFAHTVVCLSQHSSSRPNSAEEFGMATYEALRMYPLFTRSTRTDLDNRCLYTVNYSEYHRREDIFGEDANTYHWRRWQQHNLIGKTFIFGIASNRSCPGRASAIEIIPRMVNVWMKNYQTTTRIIHTRQMPCGGLAIVIPTDKRVNNRVDFLMSWLLSWLHLSVWVYQYITFFLAKKWWIKSQNLIAAENLREADIYYQAISRSSVLCANLMS